MAAKFSITAETRENIKNSARKSRASGNIPGSLYGFNTDPISFEVNYSDFLRLFRKAGQASLIDVKIGKKTIQILVHDYVLDPVKDTFQHLDFLAIDPKAPTIVHVPFVFEGEAPAVKNLGGTFIVSQQEIVIRCLPSDIPHDIKVDISGLNNLHDGITISDLGLADNLEVMHLDIATQVCSIAGRKATDSDEPSAEIETAVAADDGATTEE